MTDESEWRSRFEQMGEEGVRERVYSPLSTDEGFSTEVSRLARNWLAEKARKTKAEQRRTEIAAVVAAAAAVVGLIVAVIAWRFPLH
jgi:hypothetical protein